MPSHESTVPPETNSTDPVTALVDQFYAEVQALGGNRWDTSSLIALLQRNKKG